MTTTTTHRPTRANPRPETTMKAITRDRFGSPDVLQFHDIDRPAIPTGHVLVGVDAAGVNRGDALELRGWPYLARLMGFGVHRPTRPVLGTDIVGRVVALSADAVGVDIDDEVIGIGTGAFAQLATVPSSMLIPRPDQLSVEHAASMPTTGITALQAIRKAGRVQPGQHVAIIGAAGGVGTFAVQIAKADGAKVTGVVGPTNVDMVRSIGADHIVDYTTDDIADHTRRYDVIVDLVGQQRLRKLRRALTPTGTLVVVGGQNPHSLAGMRRFAAAAVMSPFGKQRLVPLLSTPHRDDLTALTQLVTEGAVRPIVGRTFDLSDTAEAVRQIETGHDTGRTVITT